jgi:FKBP-type peptidyl-prolyl cis-trans isomerase FklB
MNTRLIAIGAIGLVTGVIQAADKPEFKDARDKNSYCLGVNWGNNLKRQDVDVDLDLLIKGLRDASAGTAGFSEEEVREAMMALNKEVRAHQEEKRKQQGEKNKQEGEKFLSENKTKPGVITLPSGLQYKVLTEGQGESPKSNDVVTVNYRGTAIDGTEFDSSYKRGQPATFGVSGVIKGWTEALELMKPGAKWQLFVPGNLAYGEFGKGQQIGPNQTLLFEVELLSSKAPQPPPTPPVGAQPVTSDIIKVPSKEELEKGAKIEVIKASDLEKLQKEQKEKEEKKKEDKK